MCCFVLSLCTLRKPPISQQHNLPRTGDDFTPARCTTCVDDESHAVMSVCHGHFIRSCVHPLALGAMLGTAICPSICPSFFFPLTRLMREKFTGAYFNGIPRTPPLLSATSCTVFPAPHACEDVLLKIWHANLSVLPLQKFMRMCIRCDKGLSKVVCLSPCLACYHPYPPLLFSAVSWGAAVRPTSSGCERCY